MRIAGDGNVSKWTYDFFFASSVCVCVCVFWCLSVHSFHRVKKKREKKGEKDGVCEKGAIKLPEEEWDNGGSAEGVGEKRLWEHKGSRRETEETRRQTRKKRKRGSEWKRRKSGRIKWVLCPLAWTRWEGEDECWQQRGMSGWAKRELSDWHNDLNCCVSFTCGLSCSSLYGFSPLIQSGQRDTHTHIQVVLTCVWRETGCRETGPGNTQTLSPTHTCAHTRCRLLQSVCAVRTPHTLVSLITRSPICSCSNTLSAQSFLGSTADSVCAERSHSSEPQYRHKLLCC